MTGRITIVLVACVAVSGAGAIGFFKGRSHGIAITRAEQVEATAKLQNDLFEAAEQLSRANAEVLNARATRHQAARSIEDEARADPGAAARRPSPDSLQRLHRRWGATAAP